MHTVCLTQFFMTAAQNAGMAEAEVEAVILFLAANPEAGAVIPGTGGCRKVRIAGRGKGKSGGYRTITFYSGVAMPVYLLTVFAKGEKSTLTEKEEAALKVTTKLIVAEHKARVTRLIAQGRAR